MSASVQLSPLLRCYGDHVLAFWCPGCSSAHVVRVGVGKGPWWEWNENPASPTFYPSILVTYEGVDAGQRCRDGRTAPPAICHSYITEGYIEFLNDSTHAMCGQTMPLPDWPDDLANNNPRTIRSAHSEREFTMSYSMSIRAATKDEAKQKLADDFAKVVEAQPSHSFDQESALAVASQFIDLLPNDEEKDVSVTLSGSLSGEWEGSDIKSVKGVAVSVTAVLVDKVVVVQ